MSLRVHYLSKMCLFMCCKGYAHISFYSCDCLFPRAASGVWPYLFTARCRTGMLKQAWFWQMPTIKVTCNSSVTRASIVQCPRDHGQNQVRANSELWICTLENDSEANHTCNRVHVSAFRSGNQSMTPCTVLKFHFHPIRHWLRTNLDWQEGTRAKPHKGFKTQIRWGAQHER